MPKLKIPYGTVETPNTWLELEVPDNNLSIQLLPQEPETVDNLADAVEKAVESPAKGRKLSELVQLVEKIIFIVENQFRPAPAREILPVLIERARAAGCEPSIIIGNAAFPPLTPQEIKDKVGPAVLGSGIPIYCNDTSKPEQYCYLGTTRQGRLYLCTRWSRRQTSE